MSTDSPGVEFNHGYTYSGHPVACAAGMATLDIYEEEKLFQRANQLENVWLDGLMSFQGEPNVIDARGIPLIGAIELAPRDGEPMQRGTEVSRRCYQKGAWVRTIGDIIVLSPPLIVSEEQVSEILEIIRASIREVD